jgi:hypothetical protein
LLLGRHLLACGFQERLPMRLRVAPCVAGWCHNRKVLTRADARWRR